MHCADLVSFVQMGIEFKEPTFSLNHKCQKLLKNNMVFSLNLGFQGIQDPKKSEKTCVTVPSVPLVHYN